MSWLELLERKLIMIACFNDFTLWYLLSQFCNSREELWFIGSFEVLVLLTIQESNKVWNGVDLECLGGVLSLLCVDGGKD